MSNEIYVSRAPVRVDPAGGGTDCPPFSVEYGGAVLNFGITHYVYARLEILPKSHQVTIKSEDFNTLIRANSLKSLETDGQLDLLKGIARHMQPKWGFNLTVRADVRPGSGLGSSGAVGVACVGAFDNAMGLKRDNQETAELANSIERKDLGMAGGSQDSYGAAFGGINLITYHKGESVSNRQLDIAPDTWFELERRCLLVYTGEVHLSGSIHKDIRESYSLPNSPTVDAMKNLARVATESAQALENGQVNRFGKLLNENWEHHKRLHESCTSESLERFYRASSDYIIGGKTCGAGGGGCVLFLTKDGYRHALEQVCKDLGGLVLPFGIDRAGQVCWQVK
ncbi:MAG: hypothetical protein JXB29_04890 [Sedimentisphaerales bacterium]|nr:hypothetical protein [Sedimentisphaerales bacterium]